MRPLGTADVPSALGDGIQLSSTPMTDLAVCTPSGSRMVREQC